VSSTRYFADYRPDQNDVFPWLVRDHLETDTDALGPCFSARDAALIAWALNHRSELLTQSSELRAVVQACVEHPTTE
jgi:hypothetical protein